MNTRVSVGAAALMILGLMGLQAIALYAMGRVLICTCGFVTLWHGDINSSGNSQQISDWYTFSHIIHGFLFYAALKFLAPKLPVQVRVIIAATVEIVWELIENSSFIINRYRSTTAAVGYIGDSILNSVFDTVWETLGFIMAYKLPVWIVVGIAIFFELFVLYFVRDNLTLNVVMLAYPFEFIKNWQLGM